MTNKCDVYSFGVVLLTLVGGRRPIEPHAGVEKVRASCLVDMENQAIL
jgi:hypothetical protein